MNLDGASGLYLLDLCVDKVVLVGQTNEKRKSVCLQAFFWGLPLINIYQAHTSNEYDDGAEPNVFTNFALGTTGYFHSATIDLIRSIQRHPIVITVFQNLEGADTFEPVGTCKVKVTEKFSELISRAATCAVKHAVSGVIKGVYNVMNKEHIQVGTLSVNVRLVCYDNSLLKAPYIPPNQSNAVGNIEDCKYLLPKKTSDGFVLVPAEGPGDSFTESGPNEQGLPNEHQNNTLWSHAPLKGAAVLSPIDITGLVCDTTMSERFFNADQSNDSFLSHRRGDGKSERRNEAYEYSSYTVEHPQGKQVGGVEEIVPHDESNARKMTIETYLSDSGTDTKRRIGDAGKVTDSVTQMQEQLKKPIPVKIYGKEGSAENSRHSSLPAYPDQDGSQLLVGSKYHTYTDRLQECSAKTTTYQASHITEEGHTGYCDFTGKSTNEYVMSAFAPRNGLKNTSCDPLNYEYSKASQRICEKYLSRRQEKSNTTSSKSKPFKKQTSQNQVSEMSFEQMETTASPIPSQFSCPGHIEGPINVSEYTASKEPIQCSSPLQIYPDDKPFETHYQTDQQSLVQSRNQSPREISPEIETRQSQNHLYSEKTVSKPSQRQPSFVRQNCVQDDLYETPCSQGPQAEDPASKLPTQYQTPSEISPEDKPAEWQQPQYPPVDKTASNSSSGHQLKSREAAEQSRESTSGEVTECPQYPFQQSQLTSSNRPPFHRQSNIGTEAAKLLPYAEETDLHTQRPYSEYQNVKRHDPQTLPVEKNVSRPMSSYQTPVQYSEAVDSSSQHPRSGEGVQQTSFHFQSSQGISQDQTQNYNTSHNPQVDSKIFHFQALPICPGKETALMHTTCGCEVFDTGEYNQQSTESTQQQVPKYSPRVPDDGRYKSNGRENPGDEALKTQPNYSPLSENSTVPVIPAFEQSESKQEAMGLFTPHQSRKTLDLEYQAGQNAREDASQYPPRQQTLPDDRIGREPPACSSYNYNTAGGVYGYCAPISTINPESLIKYIGSERENQFNVNSQANGGWNAVESGRSEHQFGGSQDETKQALTYGEEATCTCKQNPWPFFQDTSCNEELSNQLQTAAEKAPLLYGGQQQIHSQSEAMTIHYQYGRVPVNHKCDSTFLGTDRKPQGAALLPVDCPLGAEGLTRNTELEPQNSFGGVKTEEQEPPAQYQPIPVPGENIPKGCTYSHPCSPFRSSQKAYIECQRENNKTVEPNTQAQTQHKYGGFQPYQKDSRSKHQATPRSKGSHNDTRHSHARRAAKHAATQQECSLHRGQYCEYCESSTEKLAGNFSDYGNVDNVSGKQLHLTCPSVETADQQTQLEMFSQYRGGKQLYPEAAVWGTKADPIEQEKDNIHTQSCDQFLNLEKNAKDTREWKDDSGTPRWQSAGYANSVCPNDDRKFDGSSVANETARRKSKHEMYRKFSGHFRDPRENRRNNQEPPTVYITPVDLPGNFKDIDHFYQWDGIHSVLVSQNIDNGSTDNSNPPERETRRSTSEPEPKKPVKAMHPSRSTTPSCNVPKINFSKSQGGQQQNTGYSHYGVRPYYHDYRDLGLSRYGIYGAQMHLNSCAADGCKTSNKSK